MVEVQEWSQEATLLALENCFDERWDAHFDRVGAPTNFHATGCCGVGGNADQLRGESRNAEVYSREQAMVYAGLWVERKAREIGLTVRVTPSRDRDELIRQIDAPEELLVKLVNHPISHVLRSELPSTRDADKAHSRLFAFKATPDGGPWPMERTRAASRRPDARAEHVLARLCSLGVRCAPCGRSSRAALLPVLVARTHALAAQSAHGRLHDHPRRRTPLTSNTTIPDQPTSNTTIPDQPTSNTTIPDQPASNTTIPDQATRCMRSKVARLHAYVSLSRARA
jgi:hypothetical protein